MSRVKPKRTPRTHERTARKALGTRRLEALVEEATIDESEQRVGFLTILEEQLASLVHDGHFRTPACVERVDLNDAEEIVAICLRGRQRQLNPSSIAIGRVPGNSLRRTLIRLLTTRPHGSV